MAKPSSAVPTLRQVLKSGKELEFWNNYVAAKVNIGQGTSIHAVVSEVGKFNDLYQKEWMDRPINEYCDAMSRYINLLGT